MSPLAFGPSPGPHRVLGPRTRDRCQVHRRVLLGPRQVQGPGEAAAGLRLAADAAARLGPEVLDLLPRVRPMTNRQARCTACVQEYADAAVARVMGDDR